MSLPPFRHFLYVLGTVNAVMAAVLFLASLAFSGGVNIIVEGLARARADVVTRTGTSMRARITPLPETFERTIEVEAHVRRIQELIEKALSLSTGLSEELRSVITQELELGQ